MERRIIFLLFFGVSQAYNANNVDIEDAIYFNNPGGSNNQFGHSVALGKNPNGHLGVQYVYLGAPHDETHGNVFGCGFRGDDPKKQVPDCFKMRGKIFKNDAKEAICNLDKLQFQV